ncbi:MAG TPA: glycosyltransferase, partial [Delftia acidovorans]|nr:glycosyltransferase [Delftia acidovorans]
MPSSPLANAFAAAAQPPSIDSELTRIRAMVDRAQFLEALSDLAQLVARDPRNSKVWLHIGFVYVRMSIWPQAMEALQMALEI